MKCSSLHMLVFACVVAIQHALPALAADTSDDEDMVAIYGDKATVSIATGSKQTLRRAPAVATVVTAEDIAALGVTDLDQVLETVPGLHVARIVGNYTPAYLMRGIGAGGVANPQILMLQNGIPMTVAYSGDKGLNWSSLPVENIARIEIIRGPGSALYGADAYAGVINIITRTAADTPGTLVSAGAGSFRTWNTSLRHSGKLGPVDIAAYLRMGQTDGQQSILKADAQTLNDSRAGTHVSHAPGPVNTGYDAVDGNLDLAYANWRFRSSYKLRDSIGSGAGANSALDPVSTTKSERITSDLSWTDLNFARDWGVGVLVSYMGYKELAPRVELFPPGTRLGTSFFPEGMIGGPSRWERDFRLSAYATYVGLPGHSLRVGVGHDDVNLYRAETFKNFLLPAVGAPIPTGPQMDYGSIQPHILPHRRKVDYVYLQDEWHPARDLALTAGLRHDQYSDFGGTTNPRVALVWDVLLDVTAKLLYGQAFRAPAFNEEYAVNPVVSGNPNLKPETIKTLEAALAWQVRRDLQINMNAFKYDAKDLVRAVPNKAPTLGSIFLNTGTQTGHGVEVEASWEASRNLRLSADYAYQRSTDGATKQDAGYAPRNHYYARADWHFLGEWLVSGQVNRVADRKRVPGDARPDIADYTTLDLSLSSTRSKSGWAVSASVHNLFNADVREPSLAPGTAIPNDLPMAGRAWYVQASFQF